MAAKAAVEGVETMTSDFAGYKERQERCMSKKVVKFITVCNTRRSLSVDRSTDKRPSSNMKSRSEHLEIDCPSAKLIIAGMMLFVSYVVAISQFTYTACATPVESDPSLDASVNAPLIARQRGTYSGNDTLGEFYCYRGGTWALQTSFNNSIGPVCGNSTNASDHPQYQPFSFQANPDGSYSQQQSLYQQEQRCFVTSTSNCDSSAQNGNNFLLYTALIETKQHANPRDCEHAMETVRDACHGDNGFTRGGWYTYTDGTSYGCDVSHNGSNQ